MENDIIFAKEISIGANNSEDTVPQLTLFNRGSGDTLIRLSGGVVTYSIGIDNSSGDKLNITANRSGCLLNDFTMDSAGKIGLGGAPINGARLAIIDTALCFMPPRMTSAQMEAISTLSGGMVYNITSGGLFTFVSAGRWERLTTALP